MGADKNAFLRTRQLFNQLFTHIHKLTMIEIQLWSIQIYDHNV